MVGDYFLKDDPLQDVELDSDLGRDLYKVVLGKVAYLNKQLGYNKPYIRKPTASHGKKKDYYKKEQVSHGYGGAWCGPN